MPVEVKSRSRFKAILIAAGILFVGLAVIFGVKYLMTRSGKTETPAVELRD